MSIAEKPRNSKSEKEVERVCGLEEWAAYERRHGDRDLARVALFFAYATPYQRHKLVWYMHYLRMKWFFAKTIPGVFRELCERWTAFAAGLEKNSDELPGVQCAEGKRENGVLYECFMNFGHSGWHTGRADDVRGNIQWEDELDPLDVLA